MTSFSSVPTNETEVDPAGYDRAPSDPVYRTPWDVSPAAPPADPVTANGSTPPSPDPDPAPARRGRRPSAVRVATGEKPVWLYHHLTVTGLAGAVEEFAGAARGSGRIPWRFDGARFEEDVFHLAAAVPATERSLSIEGCHRLARQFRSLVEAHQARAAARVGHGRECPFDLHALLPVPAETLALGATHPDALAWLATHWGVTDRLRQVVLRPGATAGRRLPRGHAAIGYGFFTAGETPHRAIAALGVGFSPLRFALVPRPAD